MKIKLIITAMIVCAMALARPAAAQISDQQLAERVADAVQHCAHFTVFDDVAISVLNRDVTIGGRVTMPFKRDELAKQVGKVDGVKSLKNEITVLPISGFDDNLRERIAGAIYHNSSFTRYASMTCPPIHIIVENGRVTLTGMVSDQAERILAFSLAHVSGVLDVKNQLRIDGRN